MGCADHNYRGRLRNNALIILRYILPAQKCLAKWAQEYLAITSYVSIKICITSLITSLYRSAFSGKKTVWYLIVALPPLFKHPMPAQIGRLAVHCLHDSESVAAHSHSSRPCYVEQRPVGRYTAKVSSLCLSRSVVKMLNLQQRNCRC